MKAARAAVLVTGASKGIGTACVTRLVQDGFHVYAGVRREEDGQALVVEGGAAVTPVILDVTNAEQIAAAAELISRETGTRGLQALVNNAGIALAGPLEFLPMDELRRQLEVNVIGQFAVTQAMLPLLRRCRAASGGDGKAGRIVFMSSVAGRNALPFTGAYSASKFALEGAADSLRMELRPFGLGVSIVEPGVILTPIWETSAAVAEENLTRMPPELMTYYGKAIDALRQRAARMTRGLPPESVADVVSHALTSERPRIRYVVGKDARSRIFMQWLLPDAMRDRMISRAAERMAARFDGKRTDG